MYTTAHCARNHPGRSLVHVVTRSPLAVPALLEFKENIYSFYTTAAMSMDAAWMSILIGEREEQLELAEQAEKARQKADSTAATGDASKGANLFKVS